MYSLRHDIASEIGLVSAGPRTTLTAGGAGDATLVNGAAIDLTALATPAAAAGVAPERYNSVCFAINVWATVAAGQGLSMTALIQSSPVSNFASGVTTLVASQTVFSQTSTPGGVITGVGKIGCSLENAQQFIRVAYTPDLSAGTTDTGDIAPMAIFGGPVELP